MIFMARIGREGGWLRAWNYRTALYGDTGPALRDGRLRVVERVSRTWDGDERKGKGEYTEKRYRESIRHGARRSSVICASDSQSSILNIDY